VVPWEAQVVLAAVALTPWTARVPVPPASSVSPWTSGGSVPQALAAAWESRFQPGVVAGTATVPWATRLALAVSEAVPWTSRITVPPVSVGHPWTARHGGLPLGVAMALWDSRIAATATPVPSPWEAKGLLLVPTTLPWTAMARPVATGQSAWTAQWSVAASGAPGWEAGAGPWGAAGHPWTSGGRVGDPSLTSWEAPGPVPAVLARVEWEARQGGIAIRIGTVPYEIGFGATPALPVIEWEAAGLYVVPASVPWSAVAYFVGASLRLSAEIRLRDGGEQDLGLHDLLIGDLPLRDILAAELPLRDHHYFWEMHLREQLRLRRRVR